MALSFDDAASSIIGNYSVARSLPRVHRRAAAGPLRNRAALFAAPRRVSVAPKNAKGRQSAFSGRPALGGLFDRILAVSANMENGEQISPGRKTRGPARRSASGKGLPRIRCLSPATARVDLLRLLHLPRRARAAADRARHPEFPGSPDLDHTWSASTPPWTLEYLVDGRWRARPTPRPPAASGAKAIPTRRRLGPSPSGPLHRMIDEFRVSVRSWTPPRSSGTPREGGRRWSALIDLGTTNAKKGPPRRRPLRAQASPSLSPGPGSSLRWTDDEASRGRPPSPAGGCRRLRGRWRRSPASCIPGDGEPPRIYRRSP
jgi:hypothetical protein